MPMTTCYNCLSVEDDMGCQTSVSISNNNNSPDEPCLEDSNSSSDELMFGMTAQDNRPLRELKRRASRLSQRQREVHRNSKYYPDVVKGTTTKNNNHDQEENSDQNEEDVESDESGSVFDDPREEKQKLLSYVERNIIGYETTFVGPYGQKAGKNILWLKSVELIQPTSRSNLRLWITCHSKVSILIDPALIVSVIVVVTSKFNRCVNGSILNALLVSRVFQWSCIQV